MKAAALLVLVLVPAALAGPAAPAPIVVGGVATPGSPFAVGAAAYFRYVNTRGGVGGRTVEYRVADGGADPAAAARGLAAAGAVVLFGTEGADAVRAVDAAALPQLFVETGAAGLGARVVPFAPTWRLQGAVLAGQVRKTAPPGRVAVLYPDGPEGLGLLAAFRAALGARDVVAATTLGQLPRTVTLVVLGAGSGRAGAVSVVHLKDPRDPRWAGDPAFEKYRRTGGLRTTAEEAGMAAAFALVDALRRAGRNPSRAAVLAAARTLVEGDNPFLVPGIVVRGGRVQQVALRRWTAGRWSVFTGPLAR